MALWLVGGVLCLGFVANLLVKPAVLMEKPGTGGKCSQGLEAHMGTGGSIPWGWLIPAWLAVGVPLFWGVTMTFRNALKLFAG